MKSCRSPTKIKILRKEKRHSFRKFTRKFPDKNWNRRGLDQLIKKSDESDSIARKLGSGGQRTACHDNIDAVADLVQSQEERP